MATPRLTGPPATERPTARSTPLRTGRPRRGSMLAGDALVVADDDGATELDAAGLALAGASAGDGVGLAVEEAAASGEEPVEHDPDEHDRPSR